MYLHLLYLYHMKKIDEILPNRQLQEPRNRALAALEYTSGWVALQYARMLRPYGLTYPQYSAMRLIHSGLNHSVKELQAGMTIPGSNVSRLVEKLRQKGLVERTESADDRRRTDLRLTAAGQSMLNILTADEDRILRWKSCLTRQEAETLTYLLDKLRG